MAKERRRCLPHSKDNKAMFWFQLRESSPPRPFDSLHKRSVINLFVTIFSGGRQHETFFTTMVISILNKKGKVVFMRCIQSR